MLARELRAVEVRCDVARIGESASSSGLHAEDETGGEAAVGTVDHLKIGGGEYCCRIEEEAGQGTQCADKERDLHCSGKTFAAHVADRDKGGVPSEWNDLKEIAADFTEGLIGGSDFEAGNERNVFWNEDLLDGARGLEFSGEALFFAAVVGELADEDGERGGTRES